MSVGERVRFCLLEKGTARHSHWTGKEESEEDSEGKCQMKFTWLWQQWCMIQVNTYRGQRLTLVMTGASVTCVLYCDIGYFFVFPTQHAFLIGFEPKQIYGCLVWTGACLRVVCKYRKWEPDICRWEGRPDWLWNMCRMSSASYVQVQLLLNQPL